MADVCELKITDATDDKLWAHGVHLADALDVLDRGDFKTFPDPRHEGRRYMIGPDESDRLLTLVIEAADNEGNCTLVTGWLANEAERTLYSRSGGTKYAGRPKRSKAPD